MIGDCDYCNYKNVSIYEASELNRFFVGIMDLYEVDIENGKPLEIQIINDFHKKVFTQNLIDTNNVKQLISEIIKDDIADYQNLLNNPVQLKFHNSGVEEDLNQTLFLSWDKFSEEIKTVNRFHLKNPLDLEKLNGENGTNLPVPAVYIIDMESTITYRFFDKDYKKRPSVKEILNNL